MMKTAKRYLSGLYALVFILSWLVPFLLSAAMGINQVYVDTILILISVGIASIGFPLFLKDNGMGFNIPAEKKRLTAGVCFLLAAFIFEAVLNGSWFKILAGNPPDLLRFKYVLAVLPVALAITLQFFLVVQWLLKEHFNKISIIPAAMLSAMYPGLLISVLYKFNTEAFVIVYTASLLAFFGMILSKNFFMTFISMFLIIYSNTLSNNMLAGLPAKLVIPLFIFSLVIMIVFLIKKAESSVKDSNNHFYKHDLT